MRQYGAMLTWSRILRTPLMLKRSSADGQLARRRAVGQVQRIGHRHEHFARPLEPDRIRTAVTLDGATVVGAECLGDRRPDVFVVVAYEQPTHPLEAFGQLGGKRLKHGR